MQIQDIFMSAGAEEYTRAATMTQQTGKNITGDPVFLALLPVGTLPVSGTTPLTPDVVTYGSVPGANGLTLYFATAQIFIGTSLRPAVGQYLLAMKITDNPEIPWRIAPNYQLNIY